MFGDPPSPFRAIEAESASVWDHKDFKLQEPSSVLAPVVTQTTHIPAVEVVDPAPTPTPAVVVVVAAQTQSTESRGEKRKLSTSAATVSETPVQPVSGCSSGAVTPAVAPPVKKKRRRRNRRVKGCNCKKSRCLKLYCECYAKQIFCGPDCNCTDCCNADAPEFEDARANAVQSSLDRNTSAFFRAPAVSVAGMPRKGCKCKKSQCAKNYCECFQAGLGCMDSCRCDDCENEHGVKPPRSQGRSLLLMQQSRAANSGIAPSPRSWSHASGTSPTQHAHQGSSENRCPNPAVAPRLQVVSSLKQVKPEIVRRSWHRSLRSGLMPTLSQQKSGLENSDAGQSDWGVKKEQDGWATLAPTVVTTPLTSTVQDFSSDSVNVNVNVSNVNEDCSLSCSISTSALQDTTPIEETYEQFMKQQRLMARLMFLEKQQKSRQSQSALSASTPTQNSQVELYDAQYKPLKSYPAPPDLPTIRTDDCKHQSDDRDHHHYHDHDHSDSSSASSSPATSPVTSPISSASPVMHQYDHTESDTESMPYTQIYSNDPQLDHSVVEAF